MRILSGWMSIVLKVLQPFMNATPKNEKSCLPPFFHVITWFPFLFNGNGFGVTVTAGVPAGAEVSRLTVTSGIASSPNLRRRIGGPHRRHR
jgi:hypothetical protein